MTKEEMIAVGDGFNDLSMIQYAGLGVAMANAQEIVRQNADYITLSNEEDGVAAVVEKFILQVSGQRKDFSPVRQPEKAKKSQQLKKYQNKKRNIVDNPIIYRSFDNGI